MRSWEYGPSCSTPTSPLSEWNEHENGMRTCRVIHFGECASACKSSIRRCSCPVCLVAIAVVSNSTTVLRTKLQLCNIHLEWATSTYRRAQQLVSPYFANLFQCWFICVLFSCSAWRPSSQHITSDTSRVTRRHSETT